GRGVLEGRGGPGAPLHGGSEGVSTELTCREMVELMTAYLDGALSPDDHVRFETHLSGCDGCTNYLLQMRETVRLTGRLTEEQLDPARRDELLAAFRGWSSGR